MSDSNVAQSWPLAGGGYVLLVLALPTPNPDAIRLLEPVVTAIEEYRTAVANALDPPEAT